MNRRRVALLAAAALVVSTAPAAVPAVAATLVHHTVAPATSSLPALKVSATTIMAGRVLTVSGSGCAASAQSSVDVELSTAGGQTITTGYATPAGTWTAQLTIPPSTAAGKYVLAATCDQYSVSTSYRSVTITVTAGAPTPWTVQQPTYQPTKNGQFSAVSCVPKTTWCMAVGSYYNASSALSAETSIWNGTTWTPSPFPASTATLNSVSCTSKTYCVTVGSTGTSSSGSAALFAWNGKTWGSNLVANSSAASQATLLSVSCATSSSCVAVGSTGSASGPISFTSMNGRWAVSSPVAGSSISGLYSVSCASATWCVAVGIQGQYFGGSPGSGLAELLNGTSWAVLAAPSGQYDPTWGSIAVACPAVNNCSSAGQAAANIQGFDGSRWTQQYQSSNFTDFIDGPADIACPAVGSCTVVGSHSVIMQTAGGWQEKPLTGNAPAAFDSVSCGSTSYCIATATTTWGPTPLWTSVADLWNGTVWTPTLTSNLAGPPQAALSGVSCASTAACVAVGAQALTKGNPDPSLQPVGPAAAVSWNGTTWMAATLPTTSGADDSLSSVSCPTATFCVAVGSYYGPTGQILPLAMTDSNGTWSAKPITPFGASTDALTSVSCSSATSCFAVGNAAYRWNGSYWSGFALPSGFSASSLSCTSTTYCMAVMSAPYNSTSTTNTAARWNGSAWKVSTIPGGPWSAAGVSCASSGHCLAVGAGVTTSPIAGSTLWNGSSWKALTTPGASSFSGYNFTALDDVSCSSSSSCYAVGPGLTASGLTASWDGKVWTELAMPAQVDTDDGIDPAISCVPAVAGQCVAVMGSTVLASGGA